MDTALRHVDTAVLNFSTISAWVTKAFSSTSSRIAASAFRKRRFLFDCITPDFGQRLFPEESTKRLTHLNTDAAEVLYTFATLRYDL
jgi:hypothetical protein